MYTRTASAITVIASPTVTFVPNTRVPMLLLECRIGLESICCVKLTGQDISELLEEKTSELSSKHVDGQYHVAHRPQGAADALQVAAEAPASVSNGWPYR